MSTLVRGSESLPTEWMMTEGKMNPGQLPFQVQSPHQLTTSGQAYMKECEAWTPSFNQDDDANAKNIHRRAKRLIPDKEKDEKYWEKRKRNNLAARRSREHKRLLENDLRERLATLEEQNALLALELMQIKLHFKIPANKSFLSNRDRNECLQELRNIRQAKELRRKKEGRGDDVSSTSPTAYSPSLHTSLEDSDADKNCSESDTSPKLNEPACNMPPAYGPSAYGPFTPSASWGPAANLVFPTNFPSNTFTLNPDHQTKQPVIPSVYQSKNDASYNSFGNVFSRHLNNPYYKPCNIQGHPALFEDRADIVDLRMSSKQEQHRKTVDRSQNMAKITSAHTEYLNDFEAMAYTSNNSQHSQEQTDHHVALLNSVFPKSISEDCNESLLKSMQQNI